MPIVRAAALERRRVRVLLAFLPAAIVMVLGALIVWRLDTLQDAQRWVGHTRVVLATNDSLIRAMLDFETGYRGYALTADLVTLEPYRGSAGQARELLQRLQTLTADNEERQSREHPGPPRHPSRQGAHGRRPACLGAPARCGAGFAGGAVGAGGATGIGRELGEALTRLHVHLPVLYMSGYAVDDVQQRGLVPAGAPFVQKPFSPDGLVEQVRTLLNGGQDGHNGSNRGNGYSDGSSRA